VNTNHTLFLPPARFVFHPREKSPGCFAPTPFQVKGVKSVEDKFQSGKPDRMAGAGRGRDMEVASTAISVDLSKARLIAIFDTYQIINTINIFYTEEEAVAAYEQQATPAAEARLFAHFFAGEKVCTDML